MDPNHCRVTSFELSSLGREKEAKPGLSPGKSSRQFSHFILVLPKVTTEQSKLDKLTLRRVNSYV